MDQQVVILFRRIERLEAEVQTVLNELQRVAAAVYEMEVSQRVHRREHE